MRAPTWPKGPWVPRIDPTRRSPYDLDAGERITRQKTGNDFFPYPAIIGMVSGLMPQMDMAIWTAMYKRPTFGPNLGDSIFQTVNRNLQYQVTFPTLSKMNG